MVEKLAKALEGLKNIQFTTSAEDSDFSKKQKIFCAVAADVLVSLKVMNLQNLPSVIESMIELCDDKDSDVRMVADESLNKIIMSLPQSSMHRVLVELQKIIKRKGPARCLRAALNRFGYLSHYIRPSKGRAHAQTLIPSLIEIAKREEESIHETLASSFESIFKILGVFIQDNSLKSLIKAFLHNLSSSNPVIRRCSASCIITLVQCCRKPHIFDSYVLNSLLDCVVPICEDNSADLILGVLGCLRLLLPNLSKTKSEEGISGSFGLRKRQDDSALSVDRLIQAYELCLHYTHSKDHNVVAASLETLNQILQYPPQQLKLFFLSPSGFSRSYIHSSKETKLWSRSGSTHNSLFASQNSETSEASVAFSLSALDEALLLEDFDISSQFESFSTKEKNEPQTISTKLHDINQSFDDEIKMIESPFKEILGNAVDNLGATDTDSDAESTAMSDFIASENFSIPDDPEDKSEDFTEICKSRNQDDLYFLNEKEYRHFRSTVIDVGSFTDPATPLIYCSRHLAASFLLEGSSNCLISDRIVRVSIKSLALSCLSAIIKLYPAVLKMNLAKNQTCAQVISDVLLFCDHCDPQIRGCVSILVGQFIESALIESKGLTSDWLSSDNLKLNCEYLVDIILKGLSDKSSVCVRQALSAINLCANKGLLSVYNKHFLSILEYLPVLKHNSYWLVKVKLVEVFSTLSYICIFDLTKSSLYQEEIVDNVLIPLLGDEDSRVRLATAEALVKIIPMLYYGKSTVLDYAKPFTTHFYKWLKNKKEFPSNISIYPPFTYLLSNSEETGFDSKIEASLSRVVAKLTCSLLVPENKYFLFGYLEALKLLSEKYPATIYPIGWHFPKRENQKFLESENIWAGNLINTVLSLLVSSPLILDLATFSNATFLLGNLFGGLSLFYLRQGQQMNNKTLLNEPDKLWNVFTNGKFRQLAEEIFVHVLKVLNIYSCLAEEASLSKIPDSSPAVNTFLPLLSPVKKLEKKTEEKLTDQKQKSYSAKSTAQYTNLRRLLKNAQTNYKVSLDTSVGSKFLDLLECNLHTLSIVLEVATVKETERCAEEILSYFREIVSLRPSSTIICVLQLLRSLFGTNLASNWEEKHFGVLDLSVNFSEFGVNLFDNIFHIFIELLSEKIRGRANLSFSECEHLALFNRRKDKKINIKMADKNCLATYIRLFEPMVVKSLQLYTITGDANIQLNVLRLLNELILLRVNYCLLDEKQVFVDFILMQFDLIEHGQIHGVEALLPHIFKFLVLLSYQKQHSKPIISVPKIMQLCDGLMASDQSLQTHCIPALYPVVEDIFSSGSLLPLAEQKELETQREVLFSMLLRLVEFPSVMDMLSFVLKESRSFDEKEKWKRWSRQVIDVLIPLLSQDRLRIESFDGQNSLSRLMSSLSLSVFRPVDPLLKTLFVEPDDLNCCTSLTRWISKVTVIMESILFVKEDVLLSRLEEVAPQVNLSTFVLDGNLSSPDPFNVKSFFQIFEPSETAARFILKVISVVAGKVLDRFSSSFLLQKKLSMFFVCVYYILKSGAFHRIANALRKLLATESESIAAVCSMFHKMHYVYPLLSCQFSYFLALLNYCDRSYWANILDRPKTLSAKLVQNCSVIALADYLCDNPSDADTLRYLLSNNMEEFVCLSNEIPIKELLATIQKRKPEWALFSDSVSAKVFEISDANLVEKLLRILEVSDSSHSGILLNLLVKKFLRSPRLAISLLAGAIACRQVEFLLTLPREKVLEQIDRDVFNSLIAIFNDEMYLKRHLNLWGLLNKFGLKIFDSPLLEPKQFDVTKMVQLKNIKLDEDWYFDQVKQWCCRRNSSGIEICQLLRKLNYEKIVKIMSSPEFNKKIIRNCLRNSAILREKCSMREEKEYECFYASDPLFRASKTCLWTMINELKVSIKRLQMDSGGKSINEEILNKFFCQETVGETFWELTACLSDLLHIGYGRNIDVEPENVEGVCYFLILCLEMVKRDIGINKKFENSDKFSKNIENGLKCCSCIMKSQKVINTFSDSWNEETLSSLVNNIFLVVIDLVPESWQLKTLRDRSYSTSQDFVQLEFLLNFVMNRSNDFMPPNYVLNCIRNLVFNLCRIPMLNSRILKVPESHELQEIELLENFISRFSTVGWGSRQQFEEIWMALLSVLSPNTQESVSSEESRFIVQESVVAVEGITTLLKNTMINYKCGKLIHHGRDSLSMKNIFDKIPLVENINEKNFFEERSSQFVDNLEITRIKDKYCYGLLSVEYLWTAVKQISSRVEVFERHSQALNATGLDLPSCIHLLTELYNQWIHQTSPDIKIITSSLKSSIVISDMFTDISQFQWLLNFCLLIDEIVVEEDIVILPLIILGCCKASAIVLPKSDVCEKIKKIMLKSNSVSCRLACVRGLLYLLQSYVVCYAVNHTSLPPAGSTFQADEANFVANIVDTFLPLAIDFIQKFKIKSTPVTEEYDSCCWSLIFYLLQHYPSSLGDLKDEMLNFILSTLVKRNGSDTTMNLLIKGTERLLLTTVIDENFKDQLLKVSLEIVTHSSMAIVCHGLQLLTVLSFLDKRVKDIRQLVMGQDDPEKVMKDMEKINVLFEKLKRSYPKEAEIVADVISYVLMDFSASDVLSKVIQEFLSPHQPHQKILAGLLFKVFERAENDLLEDWVVFSLPSFIQGLPIAMSVWTLNCFFVSANSEPWLRYLFPVVQSRMRMAELEDKNLLCLSSYYFYKQLRQENQKNLFVKTFERAATMDSIFHELLSSLQQT